MNNLKKLETKKILKELDFVQSDFNYRNEMINQADNAFLKSVDEFLSKKPDLKRVFDKKTEDVIESTDSVITEEHDSFESYDEGDVIVDAKPIRLKKLYREIVKATHPDKVSNKKLNEIYLRATQFYDRNDMTGTYFVCDELDIDFDIEEGDSEIIVERIKSIRDRISFMESKLTWKWYNSTDDREREEMMLYYLKTRLDS